VGECRETKVEVVFDPGVLETLGLGNGGPDASQILDQGVAQVGQGRVSNVVADDEEEEGPCLRPGFLRQYLNAKRGARAGRLTACP
jgi:hypothetical protein